MYENDVDRLSVFLCFEPGPGAASCLIFSWELKICVTVLVIVGLGISALFVKIDDRVDESLYLLQWNFLWKGHFGWIFQFHFLH